MLCQQVWDENVAVNTKLAWKKDKLRSLSFILDLFLTTICTK